MTKPFTLELDTAYLPGVGFKVDPLPEDYRKAIRFLEHSYLPIKSTQRSLCDRLKVTARRLEWTPARLREVTAMLVGSTPLPTVGGG